MKNSVTIEAVHTHTHTQYNLINRKTSIKNALLNIDMEDR